MTSCYLWHLFILPTFFDVKSFFFLLWYHFLICDHIFWLRRYFLTRTTFFDPEISDTDDVFSLGLFQTRMTFINSRFNHTKHWVGNGLVSCVCISDCFTALFWLAQYLVFCCEEISFKFSFWHSSLNKPEICNFFSYKWSYICCICRYIAIVNLPRKHYVYVYIGQV